MSMHEDIVDGVRRYIAHAQGSNEAFISPSSCAVFVYQMFRRDDDDPHVSYCAIEHIKHVSRRELANKLGADGEDNESMQCDMFSGSLQDHYPIPVKSGAEPQYVRRDLLTTDQLLYNVGMLRKSAVARLAHADALEAYMESRMKEAA